MKRSASLSCLIVMSSTLLAASPSQSPRERIPFNTDWRFEKNDPAGTDGKALQYREIRKWVVPSGAAFTNDPGKRKARPEGNLAENVPYTQTDFDDSNWRLLNLPHDWGVEGPFEADLMGSTGKLRWFGVAWYRKTFDLPASDAGRRISLDIDGAMSDTLVWCNGNFVGGWPYGYASFRLDLTPYVKPGQTNVIAIRLNNPNGSARWYPGGGIYRNVWLVKTAPVHIAHWGTYVTTPEVSKDKATVNVEAKIDNDSPAEAKVSVQTEIFALGPDGKPSTTPVATLPPATAQIPAGQSATVSGAQTIANPRLWDVEDPAMYLARTNVTANGRVVDSYDTPFGIRSIKFTADDGFHLNGKRVQLKGVCNHHDLGALGAAFNTRAAERQLEILKEMGFNALRTSHNPPAPELLDLCDRMGILVIDEAFDTWKQWKLSQDYNRLWNDWHEQDFRAMIRRDRNHPSVILWSIGNEVPELGNPTAGIPIATELTQIAKEEDPTRLTTIGSNHAEASYNGIQNAVGVMGQNYQRGNYVEFAAKNPDIPLLGTETVSAVSSRGEYYFLPPRLFNSKVEGYSNFHISSYDLYAVPWGFIPDQEFAAQEKNPRIAGEFVWTGFDYLGEPSPFNNDVTNLLNFSDPEAKEKYAKELEAMGKIKTPSRSSYFGIVDLAGFKKDRYYLYQAHWRPDLPMVHIVPHWTWPDRVGEVTPVHVYTSGDEVELFLNGKSLGRKKKEPFQYRLRWDEVVYEPGELKAVAYKDGKPWAEKIVATAGPAAAVTLTPDRSAIAADGADLSFVTATVVDAEGRMVPRAKNDLRFEISGPGEIVATDNGDPTSHVPFKSTERKAFNGLALAIVRAKPGETGPITLRVSADGLKSGETVIKAKRP